MRVLQINTYYGTGSTGRIVEELHAELLDEGFESFCMYGRKMPNQKNDMGINVFKINNKLGFYIHKFSTHLLGKQGTYSKYFTKKAIKKIEDIKPDVIHLHNIHGSYINYNLLFNYLERTKTPVIWTFHDCWPFTGHCAYFFDVNCTKWKMECTKCPLKFAYPRSLFDTSKAMFYQKNRVFNKISNMKIITVSNWLNSLVSESFLKGKESKTIYNWIDTNIFYPRQSKSSRNMFVILGVAPGWSERKGLQDFLKLSTLLKDDERIVLIGQLGNITLPPNITHIDRTDNKDQLAEYYSAADVFVNPSKQETFGLTTAEAIACGTPVVVYDVTACPEVVGRDEKCGYVVQPQNVNAIYEAICKIRKLGSAAYCENCVNRAHNNFNKEKILKEYINEYKAAFKRRQQS